MGDSIDLGLHAAKAFGHGDAWQFSFCGRFGAFTLLTV
jgi:hypothetical protein